MGQPAARVTDMHVCPMVTGVVPHVGGPILPPCAPTVLTGMLPQARIGDLATCVGPPDVIAMGAMTVLVSGQPAARMGDTTVHGGTIVIGLPTVLIGDAGGGGGGGGSDFASVAAGAGAFAGGSDQSSGEDRATIAADRDGSTAPPAAYGKAIRIEGDAAFQKKTTADLNAIGKTPSGRKLLDDIDRSGKRVTIKPTKGGNSVNGFTSAALASKGKHGAGSDSTVNYNPDRTSLGPEPWQTRPPAVGLAHELIHAQHASAGSIDVTSVDNDSKPDPADPGRTAQEKKEEVSTAGIPPHDQGPYTENKIRGEWDPKQPQRPWY